jgi:predicted acylesterase/phospholipase RssA
MAMMFVVGRIAAKVQPKYLIVAGAVLIAVSMYQMTNVYGDLGFWYMARPRMLLGVGLPLIFIPIMTASYDGIAQSKTDQASALINAARNTGGSIGVAIVSNVLTHREQFHQSRLVESVLPSSVQYQDTLHRVTGLFRGAGQLAHPGAAAGDPMDRTAGAGTGVVPRLHGRLLGADADHARRRAARADPAQGQARWSCLHGPLIGKGDTAMNVQVQPRVPTKQRHLPFATLPFESVALVLQGGGALGAYQAGVYEALSEAGINPDWIAGISIGAINAAIIVGNPPNSRVDRLREFWAQVTMGGLWPGLGDANLGLARGDAARNFLSQMSATMALANGASGFFAARPLTPWLQPGGTIEATSFYDTRELKRTLERLVDFDRINAGIERFSVGAVNVRTGNFVYFDSATHTIRPEHVMASGALPPGFPAIEIEGEHYWDGGLVSNTPQACSAVAVGRCQPPRKTARRPQGQPGGKAASPSCRLQGLQYRPSHLSREEIRGPFKGLRIFADYNGGTLARRLP